MATCRKVLTSLPLVALTAGGGGLASEFMDLDSFAQGDPAPKHLSAMQKDRNSLHLCMFGPLWCLNLETISVFTHRL